MSRKQGRPQPSDPPEPRRYTIEFTRAAERGLASLSKSVLRHVDAKIMALGRDPRPPGSLKLEGEEGFYRIRVGDYRVVYLIEDDRLIVVVVAVGHRREIYRDF
ncbi:MAG: type II toxin-antitoxin system RelE/ParE family toxin [Isosphaeraceae bacterium]